jgi:hypothetical protein
VIYAMASRPAGREERPFHDISFKAWKIFTVVVKVSSAFANRTTSNKTIDGAMTGDDTDDQ